MQLIYTATDPAGNIHQTTNESAFETLLADLCARFRRGDISIRIDETFQDVGKDVIELSHAA